ncbi:MAG: hypothetical protein KDJ37_16480 [Hyphomicrobiaceae bacterium]|nr:hypothetical protein [Hyphomicrobiaceae bacterium]
MANPKDDGNKKDALKGAGDPKRPHATLDLKAVEIKPSGQNSAGAQSGPATAQANAKSEKPDQRGGERSTATSSATAAATGSTSATPSASASVGGATPASKPGATVAATSVPPTSPGKGSGGGSVGGGDGKGGGSGGGGGTGATSPPAAKRGGGIASFFTHMAAGIVGGFLALVSADTLATKIGMNFGSGGTTGQASEELRSRIAALEKAGTSSSSGNLADLSEKVASYASGLQKLEGIEARVSALADEQSKIEAQTQALAKRATETPVGNAEPDPRIAALEQKLSLLTSAAEGSQGAGTIPQLAAVTGKLADIESTLQNQMDAVRKNVSAEIENRVSKAAEAAEAARSGTLRIDRELADVKTEAARIAQRIEALKADNQRFSDALAAVQEEAGKVASSLEAAKSDLGQRFKSVAKPEDVASAIAPITTKLGQIEKRVESVVTAEDNRKANAERIVLSLELANLKRVVDRGLGYADELAQVKKAAAGKLDLSALDRYKSEGVPTLPELQASFRPLTHQIIDAATEPVEGGVMDRLLAGAKSVVRVRKVNHSPDDDSVEAIVARMDKALDEGRISDFVSLTEKLPARAKQPASGLLQKVEARHAVDRALSDIQNQLKASIGSAGAAASATK